MIPSPQERERINAVVAQFERDTGIQAVAAVAAKADAYPDIPWKAYAIGSGLGAIAAALNPFLVQGWSHASVIALDAMLILSGGVLLAMLAGFVAPVGRLFLDGIRADSETIQYAQALFLERELFRTGNRRAVLVVVYCFERRAVILIDTGLREHLTRAEVAETANASGASFRQRGIVPAFETAFSRIAERLKAAGFVPAAEQDEIADDVVVEERK